MRLLTLAEIDQMPLVPGTCEWCGRDAEVYALAAWTCRPCLFDDMKKNGEAVGAGTKARDRRPGEGHDHSWAESRDEISAACPDFNPELAKTGFLCPGDPCDMPGLNERPVRPNLFFGGCWAWTARDRHGRRWDITWYPTDDGRLSAWLYPAGVTRFTGTGADLSAARAEAARIAALISEEA
jgi:hypothetical protein